MEKGIHLINKYAKAISLPSLRCWVAILALSLMSLAAKAQVPIPDYTFRQFLDQYYPGALVGGTYLDTLSPVTQGITSMTTMWDIADLTGIEYFRNMTSFTMHYNNLFRKFPKLPPRLNYLYVQYSSGTPDSMVGLPPTLKTLIIDYVTNIKYIELPDSLITFHAIYDDSLGNISHIPASLQSFSVGIGTMDTVPPLPSGLKVFEIGNCPIRNLPTLPAGLLELNCSSDTHLAIPATIPQHLTRFFCAANGWSSLPPLPSTLLHFNAAANSLTRIPYFPDSLLDIELRGNQITELPKIPQKLQKLYVQNNQLSCLPVIPITLSWLYIGGNHITCLPHALTFAGISCDICNSLPFCDSTSSCQYTSGFQGHFYVDLNHNCTYAANTGIGGEFGVMDSVQDRVAGYNVITDSLGNYKLDLQPGKYTIIYSMPNGEFPTSCPQYTEVIIPNDTSRHEVDFGYSYPGTLDTTQYLVVNIATGVQRFCSAYNSYYVYYANNGRDTAINTQLTLNFDPFILPLQFSIPFTSQSGNTYTFQLGDLLPLQNGYITIRDSVSCNAIFGQSACVKANIYPLPDSLPHGPNWDFSTLEVHKRVNAANDTMAFTIINTGVGTMLRPTAYRIYEDDILLANGHVQLGIMDSMVKNIPSNGRTYRMEVDQSAGHPGKSRPRQFIELSGNPPYSLHHVVNNGQDDLDPWVAIDCHEIISSFDPNAKEVYPSGEGAQHFINPDDEELKYIVRFQNTGTDTAFSIVIRDTIDIQKLDIASFTSTISSNNFTVTITPDGLATWTILDYIPDSTINEPASHGFVAFNINQKPNLAPGTVIKNFADIYFDANTPVRTDTSFVTLQTKELIAPLSVATIISNYSITAYPNPFDDEVNFKIDGYEGKALKFELINILGQTVIEKENISTGNFAINCKGISSGLYTFRITSADSIIGSGKIISK